MLQQLQLISKQKIHDILHYFPKEDARIFLTKYYRMKSESLIGSAIYTSQNKRIMHFGEKTLSPKEKHKTKYWNSWINRYYDIVVPIQLVQEKYYISLRYTIAPIQKKLYKYIQRIFLLVALISIFVVITTIIILRSLILIPIFQLRKDLVHAGEVIQQNEVKASSFQSLQYKRKDELADVIEAFRQMFTQVRNQIKERKLAEEQLSLLNEHLEKRILYRTQELEDANQKLIHNAFHDELTGLGNRTQLLQVLQAHFTEKKQQEMFAIFIIDLDRFKYVNDSFGHGFGDKLLVAFSNRLEEFKSPETTIARIGGDEFAIYVQNVYNSDQAMTYARKIHQLISRAFYLENQEIFLTASIGIAIHSERYQNPESILRDADLVMYRAKELGRDRSEVFGAEMRASILKRIQLETELRRAVNSLQTQVQNNEFQIYFQPIVKLNDHTITGFEALLRWFHPKKGMISPNEFIPIAEETGLIVPLGSWVLEAICEKLSLWIQEFPHLSYLQFSINLSGKQFRQKDLPNTIENLLHTWGLQGQQFKLEITESSLVDDPELAREILLSLKKQDVKISMDDFGTGYSSLSYLHQFPFDTLKIDRSFVSRLQQEGKDIIRTIIALAKTLGMDVIAEGIETKEQNEALQQLHCPYGQGYYFGKPKNASETQKILQQL